MTRFSRFAKGAVLLFFFSALPALAQSQASTGAIAGRVLDGTGAALVGAAVIIANPSRAFERKVTTGADGLFAAPLVPPGTYTVSASSAGFQTLKRTEVRVTVGPFFGGIRGGERGNFAPTISQEAI